MKKNLKDFATYKQNKQNNKQTNHSKNKKKE